MAPFKGGIVPYNTLLYKELSKNHEVNIISFKRLYPKFLYPGENEKDTSSKESIINAESDEILDGINPLTWLKTIFKIRKDKPDLVVFHWWNPFFSIMISLIFSMIRSKKLLICHNVLPHEKVFMDKFLTKIALNRSKLFIVHSKEELANLNQLIGNPNAKVYPHPTYEFFDKEFDTEVERKTLNLRKKVILFFGFIRPSKGLIYLIRAMPEVLKKIDLDLLVVGEFLIDKEKLKKECTEEISKLGVENNVKLIDEYVPNEEVSKYFSVADLAVFPYISATGSGILQIAFGLRKPVICTDVLANVVDDNKTGFVVPTKNSKNLADAIIRFYEEGKSGAFIENIKKEHERFSWEGLVETIESFNILE
tara:strand:+ start:2051 stop:3148 length:1098 start_codon:yes stop_codon:yes gene_type:complete